MIGRTVTSVPSGNAPASSKMTTPFSTRPRYVIAVLLLRVLFIHCHPIAFYRTISDRSRPYASGNAADTSSFGAVSLHQLGSLCNNSKGCCSQPLRHVDVTLAFDW